MKPNPPIPGHHLVREGKQLYDSMGHHQRAYEDSWGDATLSGKRQGFGRCECGLVFGPGLSQGKVKQAHREHKAKLRGPVEYDRYKTAMILLEEIAARPETDSHEGHLLSTVHMMLARLAQELP